MALGNNPKQLEVVQEVKVLDKNAVYNAGALATVEGNANSGSYLSVRWYNSGVNGITEPYDGMKLMIKIPLAGVSTAGAMLSINGNNDADFHPLAYNVNSVLTSHYAVNSYKIFTYDASATMTCYKTKNTSVSVTGVWKGEANYDSNTTLTYGTLAYYFRPYVGSQALYRYKFVMLDKDNRLVPLTITNVANGTAVTNQTPTAQAFRPEKIFWYNATGTVSAGAVIGGNTLVATGYNANNTTNGGMAVCNFNSTVPAYRMIYLCGTYDKATGLFTLREGGVASSTKYYAYVPTNSANINLSTYLTSGYDYILLGGTYSSNTYIHLMDNNPMYHFDGTNLVPYDTYNTDSKQDTLVSGANIKTINGNSVLGSGDIEITAGVSDVQVGGSTVVSNGVASLGTAASKNTGSASGNIPVLDSNGKLASGVLPAIAITDTFVVSTQAAMLALTAEVGDVCVRTDLNKSFILKTDGASTLANWQELLTPTDAVTSVNGQTGAVTVAVPTSIDGMSGGTVSGAVTVPSMPFKMTLVASSTNSLDALNFTTLYNNNTISSRKTYLLMPNGGNYYGFQYKTTQTQSFPDGISQYLATPVIGQFVSVSGGYNLVVQNAGSTVINRLYGARFCNLYLLEDGGIQ